MKKYFAFAAMFAAVAMVACGGQQKAEEKTEEAQANVECDGNCEECEEREQCEECECEECEEMECCGECDEMECEEMECCDECDEE